MPSNFEMKMLTVFLLLGLLPLLCSSFIYKAKAFDMEIIQKINDISKQMEDFKDIPHMIAFVNSSLERECDKEKDKNYNPWSVFRCGDVSTAKKTLQKLDNEMKNKPDLYKDICFSFKTFSVCGYRGLCHCPFSGIYSALYLQDPNGTCLSGRSALCDETNPLTQCASGHPCDPKAFRCGHNPIMTNFKSDIAMDCPQYSSASLKSHFVLTFAFVIYNVVRYN